MASGERLQRLPDAHARRPQGQAVCGRPGVPLGDQRTRGLPVRFDVEETERDEGRRIAWHTSDGQLVAHTGTLWLDPAGDDWTRVQVQFTYNPVAGAVAALLGANPSRKLHDDLWRLKTALDTR